MNELALFAGAGGGILGGKLLDWRTVCAVERDAFCIGSLLSRQNDHFLESFPVWDDVRTFDGIPWRGLVDVVSGGFPCQDISPAGKGAGITGPKSGLWKEFARIIGEVAPPCVLIENSSMLVSRGLREVLTDLDALGYDAKWGDIRAEDAIWFQGTPCLDHERKRLWIRCYRRKATGDGDGDGDGLQAGELRSGCQAEVAVPCESNSPAAHSKGERPRKKRGVRHGEHPQRSACGDSEAAYAAGNGRIMSGRVRGANPAAPSDQTHEDSSGDGCRKVEQHDAGGEAGEGAVHSVAERTGGWWQTEPDVDRVVHGVSHRVDRLRAIGNAQVPAVVRLAWETLKP